MLLVGDFPPWFLPTLVTLLGLLFGSFLNVVIHRLPRGENLAYPGSRCPHCGVAIPAWRNLPVLTWVLQRGRAACCRAPISPRYVLVELLGGGVAIALHLQMVDPSLSIGSYLVRYFLYLTFALGLIAGAFIDAEQMILPDSLTIGGTLLGLASLPLRPEVAWSEALLGGALGFTIVWLPFIWGYSRLRGIEGMGFGDAKLLMLGGVWMGWPAAVFALLAGAVQGTVFAIVLLASRGRIEEPAAVAEQRADLKRRIAESEGEQRRMLEEELAADPLAEEPDGSLSGARIAFGPFLILALLEYLLFGAMLQEAYFSWLLGE